MKLKNFLNELETIVAETNDATGSSDSTANKDTEPLKHTIDDDSGLSDIEKNAGDGESTEIGKGKQDSGLSDTEKNAGDGESTNPTKQSGEGSEDARNKEAYGSSKKKEDDEEEMEDEDYDEMMEAYAAFKAKKEDDEEEDEEDSKKGKREDYDEEEGEVPGEQDTGPDEKSKGGKKKEDDESEEDEEDEKGKGKTQDAEGDLDADGYKNRKRRKPGKRNK